jgi:hypothetical protein
MIVKSGTILGTNVSLVVNAPWSALLVIATM